MTAASREQFAEVVRQAPQDLGTACALIATEVYPDLHVRDTLSHLDVLAAAVTDEGSSHQRLTRALGGMSGTPADYVDLRSSLLPDVLERQRGLPILLSVVWLEVARRVDIDAVGIGLPGHFLVALDGATTDVEGEPPAILADPWTGGTLLSPAAALQMASHSGSGHAEEPQLTPYAPVAILNRLLLNVRLWADRPERWSTGLWACELALLLPRHDADWRRAYGALLARVGRFADGARELEEFANAVDGYDTAAAESARTTARMARSRMN